MKRALQGHHVTILAKEGTTQAFVPAVLPPRPPLQWTSALADQFAQAQRALQRVNCLSQRLRNPVQFLQAHLRRERLGQHPTEEFPEFHWFLDKHHAPYVLSRKELQEIAGYWVATQHGLSKLSRGAPLSVRLLRECTNCCFARDGVATRLRGSSAPCKTGWGRRIWNVPCLCRPRPTSFRSA